MTGIMCVMAGMGQGIIDTEVVTVGSSGGSVGFVAGSLGSIVDGLFLGTTAINQLFWASDLLTFQIDGETSDTGFTTMTVNGTPFARTAATFGAGGGVTGWSWSTSNPFTAPATETTVTFT